MTGNASQEQDPYLARWPDKRSLVLNMLQDRSAQESQDPLKRNLAIFSAVGRIGYMFKFGVSFRGSDGDISVVFVGENVKNSLPRNFSNGVFTSSYSARCPAYLESAHSEGKIKLISKVRVLVSDQLSLLDLPGCLQTGLLNAIGLIGLRESDVSTETKEERDQLEFFISTLYEAHNVNSSGDIEAAVSRAKGRLCQ